MSSAPARRLGAVALSAAAVLLFSACSSTPDQDSAGEGDASGDRKSIVLITPTPIGTNNFLQLSADGAEEAGTTHDADVTVYESQDTAAIQQNLDEAVRAQPDVIIGVSFSVAEQFAETAANNPDQQFLLVDSTVEDAPANLTAAAFKEHEAEYLIGVEAGLLTDSNTIGVVAALDTPVIHRWIDPFFAGAQSINPDIETLTQYVGGDNPFGDAPRAKAQAKIIAEQGADFINAAASGGNLGVFEAAEEDEFLSFGVDTNQCLDSPGNVVDNALKRVDVAIVNAVGDIVAGNAGGVKVYGLAEGGVDLTGLQEDVADSECLIADYPDVIEQVTEVRDQIVSGEIVVEDPLAASAE